MAHDTMTINTAQAHAYEHEFGYTLVEEVTATSSTITNCAGFIPSATGVAVITPAGQSTAVSLPVIAGTLYPISITGFNTVGSTATQKLYLLRQRFA